MRKKLTIAFIAVFLILGVVFAPITSGDTAFRSARLIIADIFAIDQAPIRKRLLICVPMFLIASGILLYSLSDVEGFNIVWRYFAWANQTLGVITLWALSVWLCSVSTFLTCVFSMRTTFVSLYNSEVTCNGYFTQMAF